jgi:predicted ATP-dependent Lon-type protease
MSSRQVLGEGAEPDDLGAFYSNLALKPTTRMRMDELDQKLNATFDGKVLRKDLLHRIKKGTNVPPSSWSFCWRKFCASNDQAEMDAGMEAVLSSLQDNYVRPDEANAAQSKVATKGKHRFIDKVHVRYVEKEKRHWASLENFNSQRIAIGEKFYRDNDRLLEGGIWAEVTLAHNDIEEDDYAFYIEDLRPIQLSVRLRRYTEGRGAFTRDEWLAPSCGRWAWSRASCRSACGCTSSRAWRLWSSPTTTTSNWARAAPASRTSSASSRPTPH